MKPRLTLLEQATINPLTSYVPTGSYIVKSKLGARSDEYIISPGVQSCVVVVLDSPHGVAVGHFDSPFVVAQTIQEMLSELKKMGEGAISGGLYGGNYGNPLSGSSMLSNAINAELKSNKIPFTHTDYFFTNSYLMAAIALVWSFSPAGLDSKFQSFMVVLIAYFYPLLMKALLPKNMRPDFVGANRNVFINVQSGNVYCNIDDNWEGTNIIMKLFIAQSREEYRAIYQRSRLNPQNPKNIANLGMFKLKANKPPTEFSPPMTFEKG